jgi:hypothetical protein
MINTEQKWIKGENPGISKKKKLKKLGMRLGKSHCQHNI